MKNNDNHGSVTIDRVSIRWNDSRYMGSDGDDLTGDMDLRGEYSVSVSVDDGDINDIAHAIACAKRLKMLSLYTDVLCPVPGSEHVLQLAGIDSLGGPVWRVIVGDRVCDAIPACQMAHLDPSHYTESGEIAMHTIAWMRAVGRITSGWHDGELTRHVLCRWDSQTVEAACLQHCQSPGRDITGEESENLDD